MRSLFGLLWTLIVCSVVGTGGPGWLINAQAASIERQSAIDGTTGNYAVISPVFTGTQTSGGPQSYVRLFNGAGAAGSNSTFGVTVVGTPSGQIYGSSTNIQIPYFASIQYSIQEILSLAGAGALTGGDTGYALFLHNADAEAGYQHAVYNWTTSLFEDVSSCGTPLNEQMLSVHNELVLTGVQTSKLSYPSSVTVFNYSAVPVTYTLTVYNAGIRTNGVISANSGKQTCQITGNTVAANSSLSLQESAIEAHAGCTLDSDESYMNIVVTNSNAASQPNATLTHLVHVTAYNGDSNLTDTCAVNAVASSGSGPYYGNISPLIGSSGIFKVTVNASVASGSLNVFGGSAVALSGTYTASTNKIALSGGGYSFSGTISGGIYVGTYTGPAGSNGGFYAMTAAQSSATNYCSTSTEPSSIQISANGVVSGESTDADGANLAIITGQVTGSSLSAASNEGGVFTGTVQNGTISGTHAKAGGSSKTFSASTAACGS